MGARTSLGGEGKGGCGRSSLSERKWHCSRGRERVCACPRLRAHACVSNTYQEHNRAPGAGEAFAASPCQHLGWGWHGTNTGWSWGWVRSQCGAGHCHLRTLVALESPGITAEAKAASDLPEPRGEVPRGWVPLEPGVLGLCQLQPGSLGKEMCPCSVVETRGLGAAGGSGQRPSSSLSYHTFTWFSGVTSIELQTNPLVLSLEIHLRGI